MEHTSLCQFYLVVKFGRPASKIKFKKNSSSSMDLSTYYTIITIPTSRSLFPNLVSMINNQ